MDRVSAVIVGIAVCIFAGMACAQQPPAQAGVYPDPNLTPGNVQETDYTVFCVRGWPSSHRNVSQAEKDDVYSNYGLPGGDYTGYCSNGCEMDHLIPLELGGANDETNLWPQLYTGDWNAHTKDALENQMKKLVCCQALDASVATTAISTDWIKAYNTYMSQSC